ncbi:MAG TPA: HEPN domain-containing protein [Candidatus Binataceae bacterium]|nr:HEPN domain-containing protein [Candidatus Binataceae bacterium]
MQYQEAELRREAGYSAGYLSHLGIELELKAFLLHFTGEFPDTHSLKVLLGLIREKGLKVFLTEEQHTTAKELDLFYELRYPRPDGSPSIGSLAWPRIHALHATLGEQLPKELQEAVLKLDRTRKFGRVLMKKPKDGGFLEDHAVVVDNDVEGSKKP